MFLDDSSISFFIIQFPRFTTQNTTLAINVYASQSNKPFLFNLNDDFWNFMGKKPRSYIFLLRIFIFKIYFFFVIVFFLDIKVTIILLKISKYRSVIKRKKTQVQLDALNGFVIESRQNVKLFGPKPLNCAWETNLKLKNQ